MTQTYTRPTPRNTDGLVVTIEASGSVKAQRINIIAMTDNPVDKLVTAFSEQAGIIKLWEGTAYDTIGQWTNQDVITRVTQLAQSGSIGK